jgi:hypothetical protein
MKEITTDSVVVKASEEGEELGSINSDDALLMSMGKEPELKRVYNFWTVCGTLNSWAPHTYWCLINYS